MLTFTRQGSIVTATDGDHNHAGITGNAVSTTDKAPPEDLKFDGGSLAHYHPITDDGDHTHTMSGNSASAGSATQDFLPPYKVIRFMIKT